MRTRALTHVIGAVPDDLTEEQVLMCSDIMSTGFGGASSSLGVDSTELQLPLDAVAAGRAHLKILTILYPGGEERRPAEVDDRRWPRTITRRSLISPVNDSSVAAASPAAIGSRST